jgi:hypothetical protein
MTESYYWCIVAFAIAAVVMKIFVDFKMSSRRLQEKEEKASEARRDLEDVGKALCRDIEDGWAAFPQLRDGIILRHSVEDLPARDGESQMIVPWIVITLTYDGSQKELEGKILPKYVRPVIESHQQMERKVFVLLRPQLVQQPASAAKNGGSQ